VTWKEGKEKAVRGKQSREEGEEKAGRNRVEPV
jgi:hypothetical protein